jgi:exopolyphosphatase/guanosine-5'-triphosphate,3'-diphosphate pyrophosphatase
MPGRSRRPRVAVIDIGSNSGRVVAFEMDEAGELRILASTRAALRLVREVDEGRRLSEEAMARAMEALHDFKAMAVGAGARRVAAVATAAMRDADNGPLFMARVHRELGLRTEIIDGEAEARFGFLGALHGLGVESGLLFDLGGGSLQVSRFEGRRLRRATSLPLGALRMSRRFLESDPPRTAELRRLRAHVLKHLDRGGVLSLRRGESLVGTGGTLRNLAKLDRRGRAYPVSRLHGYLLPAKRLGALLGRLAGLRLRKREELPGLSDERGDSIVGGAVVIEALAEATGAPEIVVSGQGVREGVALSLLGRTRPGDARQVREAALLSLASRFDGWTARSAERRRALARELYQGLEPRPRPELARALGDAAYMLDVGRSIDFFDRHAHGAEVVLAAEMNGFSHRETALLASVLRRAGDEGADLGSLGELVRRDEDAAIERAAVLLVLADDLEERCPPDGPIRVVCRVKGGTARVDVPRLPAWRPRKVGARFTRAFGWTLVVRPGLG